MSQLFFWLHLLLVFSSSKLISESETSLTYTSNEFWDSIDSEPMTNQRNLRTENQSLCYIKNCIKCSQNYKICETCKTGYKLQDQGCVCSNSSQENDMSQNMLIAITVSLSLFTILFCIFCLYYARKFKPKYTSGSYIDQNKTESACSVDEVNLPDDRTSQMIYLESSENLNNRNPELTENNLNRLKQIYQTLPTIPKDKNLDDDCLLCYSSLNSKILKKLNCQHYFHRSCCKDWIMNGNIKCPACSENLA